ncbi:MAG: type II secretion system GspH family protein [Sulfurimonas sp.]|nr:type II secretion system GspH family protein [Sulfurimonas sp.]
MKKAFTMLELVFVIVVIGILAATIIPNTRTNPLQEAALQIVSDIQYTQHLAMVDDRYDANNLHSTLNIPIWYRERWQILFSANGGSGNVMGYTIFSDTAGDSAGNPDATEIAQNPSNSSELMTGGINSLDVTLDIDNAGFVGMNKLNLERSYGVDVEFDNTCRNTGSRRIAFDHIGRPIKGNLTSNLNAYDDNDLIEVDCDITLTHVTGDTLLIRVHRETGYVCILDAGNCI